MSGTDHAHLRIEGHTADASGQRLMIPDVHSAELLSIQYLRALAAIAVLAFHATARVGVPFDVGAAGVDVFFIISGFIIWTVGARRTPGDFLARRAGRIVPLYWLITLAVAVIATVIPSSFPNLHPNLDRVVLSLLFYPHHDPNGDVAPLVTPGWTLDYEVFFYLIFTLALWATASARLILVTAVLIFLVVVRLIIHPTYPSLGLGIHPADPRLATYTSPLLLEFLAGVWLAKVWSDGIRFPRWAGIAAVACGLFVMSGVAVSGLNVEPVRLLVFGLPAFLIVAGALALEPLPAWPVPKFLGDASYSIYLVHGLAIGFCARLLGLFHFVPVFLLVIVSIAGGILLGSACHLLVEQPLLGIFHPARRKRPPRDPTPLSLMPT
jgi:exopolysaccharide production protein ExoZ